MYLAPYACSSWGLQLFFSFHPCFEDTQPGFLLAKQLEVFPYMRCKQTIRIIIHGPAMTVVVICGTYLNFKLNACSK